MGRLLNINVKQHGNITKLRRNQQIYHFNYQMKGLVASMISNNKSITVSEGTTQQSTIQPCFSQPMIGNSRHFEQKDNIITQFQSLVSIFEKIASKINQKPKNYEVEPRDRQIIYQLPDLTQGRRLEKSQLELWITSLCRQVFSSAFHYFEQGRMSFDQAKIYCSENVISNIVRLNDNYKLQSKEVRWIDEHIEQGVTAYLLAKYPMTQTQPLNNVLHGQINEVDSMDSLQNDLFYDAPDSYGFQLRQSGNYNDLIMVVVNDLIRKVDQKDEQTAQTLYGKFYRYMNKTFDLVQSHEWMESGTVNTTKDEQNKKQKQEYRIRIKSYTSWAIGRKIPENVAEYSETEIASKHMIIRSPAILRILTKWCDQLWDKFQKKNYFLDRGDNLKCQRGGNVNTSFAWLKNSLNQLIQEQRIQVQKFLAQIFNNNYDQQAVHLFRSLRGSHFTHVEAIQKAAGIFTVNIVNNLHSYVLLYLNRLIHGLLKVARRVYDKQLAGRARWTSPPNLISFKIGDLMRCKIQSKDKEVLQLYRHLNALSRTKPNEVKIIRIKNRLREGTSDILLNIRFTNSLICEVQLAVNSDHSNFMKCSNKYNHFIYEVKRSIFGPLTQFCSIWRSLDGRCKVYQKISTSKKQLFMIETLQTPCQSMGRSHRLNKFNQPFVCSTCQQSYSHSNYIWPHQRCDNCKVFTQCCRCRLHHMPQEQLKIGLFKGALSLKEHAAKFTNEEEIPRFGVCFQIESKDIILQKFIKLTVKGKTALYTHNNKQEIQLICQVNTSKEMSAFKEKYVVFRLPFEQGKKQIKITEVQVNNEYLMPKVIRSIYQKEKQFISLTSEEITDQTIQNIMGGTDSQRQHIKVLQLPDNKLIQLYYIAKSFPNLNKLILSRNSINDISPLSNLTQLQELNLRDNMIGTFPISLCSLKRLTNLNLRNNNISQIPEQIGQLTLLTNLDLNYLTIQQLPQSLSSLINLQYLDISKNKLGKVPDQLRSLLKLRHLAINNNYVHNFPDWIGELTKLRVIQASKNQLEAFPETIMHLIELQELHLDGNSFKELNFKCPQSLTTMLISDNQISTVKEVFLTNCKNLSMLKMSNNQIASLPLTLSLCKNLRSLILDHNKLTTLPSIFGIFLPSLQRIDLSHNQFKRFPKELISCPDLRELQLFNNPMQDSILERFLENCIKIERLDVSCTKISHLPAKITLATGLKYLNLNESSITSQSLEILRGFKNVEDLRLCKMGLVTVPASLKEQHFLQTLNLKDNGIEYLVEDFFEKLTHLRSINFQNNQISKVPDSLKSCKRLKVINFNHNIISQFPQSVCHCHRLQRVDFNHNAIQKIETQIPLPASVVDLSLKSNRICFINDSFFRNADNLIRLDLSKNILLSIPRLLRKCNKLIAPNFQKNPIQIKTSDIVQQVLTVFAGPSEVDGYTSSILEHCRQ